VNRIDKNLILTKEIIREEPVKDILCQQYRQREGFRLDEANVLYKKEPTGQPYIVIPNSLVPTVMESYHDINFTAHQGVGRTM
jgi:hypothetical protein